MNRLVTFGCSFTYGDELPDCQSPVSLKNTPSEYAWPQLTAQQLNLECVNMAEPSIGNKHILFKILNFDFAPTDTVVIMWTLFERHCVIDDHFEVTDLGPWFAEKVAAQGADCRKGYCHNASYAHYVDPGLHTQLDDIFNNLVWVNSANSHLARKKITAVNLSLPNPDQAGLVTIHGLNNRRYLYRIIKQENNTDSLEKIIKFSKSLGNIKPSLIFDDGRTQGELPGGHPSVEAHGAFAGRLVNHIEQKRGGTST